MMKAVAIGSVIQKGVILFVLTIIANFGWKVSDSFSLTLPKELLCIDCVYLHFFIFPLKVPGLVWGLSICKYF